jgi:hypothetical protein
LNHFTSKISQKQNQTISKKEIQKKSQRKMSGIINKIGETLHIGGHKKEDEHKGEKHGDEHKGEKSHDDKHKGEKSHDDKHKGEHKEGVVEKLKDKIHGGEDHEHKGEKKDKKKKDKKKKEHGHDHDSSSSSDSD